MVMYYLMANNHRSSSFITVKIRTFLAILLITGITCPLPALADLHDSGAAAVGAAQVGALVDEEAVGKAGAPERTGLPRDPANARSKKMCYTAVLVAGFALAIDFTMSLMSIQVPGVG